MELVEYTEFLVKSLVKDSELIKVELMEEDGKEVLEVMVPDDTMKYVIGHSGRNINAIRTLINAYTLVNKGKRVRLNVESF